MRKSIILVLLVIILSGCSSPQPPTTNSVLDTNVVNTNSNVLVHYTGTLENGEVFDSSLERDPLSVKMGQGQLIKGFEEALLGMKVGQEKKIKLTPEEGYGLSDPELIQSVSKTQIDDSINLEVGTSLYAVDTNGFPRQAIVVEINDDELTLDLNHPLADKTLIFDLKIVEIKS